MEDLIVDIGRTQPSMSDVARHAGVALGTVSNTLNSPEKVSQHTREKVHAAIAELGFVRNDAARSLASGSSTTVGLVVADLGNSLFVDIARGAEEVIGRRGMNVLIANTDVQRDREIRNLELFERARVAGIIFAPLDTPDTRAAQLPITSTPIVLVNFASASHEFSSVAVDERHGGAMAVDHLIGLGRTRLLFVGGPLVFTAVSRRNEGGLRAAAGIDGVTFETLETRGLQIRHGREAARWIIERGAARYDGIIAASDLVAMGLVQGLSAVTGLRIPDDVAITGYDDNHFASETSIPITTVGQPGEEMGRVAAELLLARMDDRGAAARSVTLEPHLIARRSTLGDAWQHA